MPRRRAVSGCQDSPHGDSITGAFPVRQNSNGGRTCDIPLDGNHSRPFGVLALPLARVTIQREREKELRKALWEMRDAIDRYKDATDRNMVQTKVDSQGYPPDLETMVKGVEAQGGKKIRFLRS